MDDVFTSALGSRRGTGEPPLTVDDAVTITDARPMLAGAAGRVAQDRGPILGVVLDRDPKHITDCLRSELRRTHPHQHRRSA